MEYYFDLRHVQDHYQTGKHLMSAIWRTIPRTGNSVRFDERVFSTSAEDQSRLHEFGNMHCMREEFGKEIFWSQSLMRAAGNLDASVIHARRLKCEGGLHAEKW